MDNAKDTNPKNRDFQRTEDDTDNVSASEKKFKEAQGNKENLLGEMNPKNRDFLRKEGDADSVSSSENESGK